MPAAPSEQWVTDLLTRLQTGPVRPPDTVALQRYVSEYVDTRVGWLDDVDFATQLSTELRLPDREADEYLHQRVDAGGDIGLAGIRFLNGDPTKPFVDLEASTGKVTPEMCRAALDAFGMFDPQSVRFTSPEFTHRHWTIVGVQWQICTLSLATSRICPRPKAP